MSSGPIDVIEPPRSGGPTADGFDPYAAATNDSFAAAGDPAAAGEDVAASAGPATVAEDVAGFPCAIPPPPAPPVSRRCSFTGTASDYFRIWIVNLLLTLITLGLWSPWAKVRKRRYFYGHTWVADANFEYHGNPFAILRGRLLAAAAFGVYWIVDHLRPGAGPWLLLALIAGAPWIIARSLTFNAVNSSHRGVRFGFACRVRTVAAAIWPIVLWPVAVMLASRDPLSVINNTMFYVFASFAVYTVLMSVYPYAIARVRRLTIDHASWGLCHFGSNLRTSKVYAVYGIAMLLGLLILVAAGAVGFGLGMLLVKIADKQYSSATAIFWGAWTALWYGFVVAIVMGYTRSRITNMVFNTARLGNVAHFKSTVSARKLAKLYAGNLGMILITCGLMIPWAVIRVARYRVESLAVILEGPLDEVTGAVSSAAGAAGEEMGEIFGFDLAL